MSRRIHFNLKDGTFTIEVGEAQGIANDACFDIYNVADENTPLLCRMVAYEVGAFNSTLVRIVGADHAACSTIHSGAWALQIDAGQDVDVCIAVPDEDLSLAISERIKRKAGQHGKAAIRLVEKPEISELTVMTEGEEVMFNITDEPSCNLGLRRIPYSLPRDVDSIYTVLQHAADFFWHLRRSSQSHEITQGVVVEAHQLAFSVPGEDGTSTLVPTGANLNQDGIIEMSIEDGVETKLGFTITNTLRVPLYVWVFNFNMSDLRIGVSFTLKLSLYLISDLL